MSAMRDVPRLAYEEVKTQRNALGIAFILALAAFIGLLLWR